MIEIVGEEGKRQREGFGEDGKKSEYVSSINFERRKIVEGRQLEKWQWGGRKQVVFFFFVMLIEGENVVFIVEGFQG